MSEMGSHDPFGHLKHKLWAKESLKVKLPIWLLTTKSHELTWFPCLQVACDIPLKISRWGLQLCFRLHLNWRSANKVMGLQIVRVPILRILGLPFRNLKTKCHLDVGPMASHRIYYKGEGGGFPQVWVVVSLMSPSLPMTRPSTKSVIAMH